MLEHSLLIYPFAQMMIAGVPFTHKERPTRIIIHKETFVIRQSKLGRTQPRLACSWFPRSADQGHVPCLAPWNLEPFLVQILVCQNNRIEFVSDCMDQSVSIADRNRIREFIARCVKQQIQNSLFTRLVFQ